MLKLSRKVIVPAPPEKVFNLIDDTASIPKLWRNVTNIRNLQRIPNGGHSFEFDYMMASFKISGSSTDLDHSRPNRIVTYTTGGVHSKLSWTFLPYAGGKETDLHLDVEYDVPIPLLGKLSEMVIAKINEGDITHMLNYIKTYKF
jgi:ribosome-associated toxin RatA of RatAB toxin-antitoxin module